jgi:3-methyladenine DNA glycosylase AlkD
MTTPVSPRAFVTSLKALATKTAVADVSRFVRSDPHWSSSDNKILGVRMGSIFPLAKQFADMPLSDIEQLLENKYYEVRMGAVAIMDFQARRKRISADERKALFDLYIRRHDRINDWGMVDRAAPYVVGGYLADKPRDVLYRLARSPNPCERRTAIVSTYCFIRKGDIDDTFRIAEILVADEDDLVQRAVGSWIREAGKRDERRLVRFLETHASSMSRLMLRYAAEKLPAKTRAQFITPR